MPSRKLMEESLNQGSCDLMPMKRKVTKGRITKHTIQTPKSYQKVVVVPVPKGYKKYQVDQPKGGTVLIFRKLKKKKKR